MNDELSKLKDQAEAAVAKVAASSSSQPWSPELVKFLGVSILVFCLLVLAISAICCRGKQGDAGAVTKLFGLVVILCLSAFLMITGYGQAQLTPIIGLFGAIAGYLLGKDKEKG